MIKQKSTATIGESFKLFIATKRANGVSEKTVHNYSQSFEFFLRDMSMDETSPTSSITEKSVFEWIEILKGRGISICSVNHYLTDIRTFLYFCMGNGSVKRFKINLLRGQTPQPSFYSDEEIKLILAKPSAKENFPHYRSWVVACFVLATGARASTLVNIKLSDISFTNSEIRYRHLKNKSTATIPLSSSLSKVLREYLSSWSREQEDGWLFCDMYENQCTVSSLYQSMNHYCKSRGVEPKGLHALRHSFSRLYILNGGNAFALQRILTHKSITMTNRYVHLFADDLKKNYESFSPLDNLSASRQSTVHRK